MTKPDESGDTRETRIAERLESLGRDRFRRRFAIRDRELSYLQRWGIEKVMRDGETLLRKRVAPAAPRNDGRQTPWRNHPIFVAQHATATCCRGCIAKWHSIPKGHELTAGELQWLLDVIRAYLERFHDHE